MWLQTWIQQDYEIIGLTWLFQFYACFPIYIFRPIIDKLVCLKAFCVFRSGLNIIIYIMQLINELRIALDFGFLFVKSAHLLLIIFCLQDVYILLLED